MGHWQALADLYKKDNVDIPETFMID